MKIPAYILEGLNSPWVGGDSQYGSDKLSKGSEKKERAVFPEGTGLGNDLGRLGSILEKNVGSSVGLFGVANIFRFGGKNE